MATTVNTINVGGIDKEIEDTYARSNISYEIDRLETRIDNIVVPSGGAPSPEEVLDARTAADGTTYSSLGKAIRRQTGDLDVALSEITNASKYFIDIGQVTVNDGYYIKGDGELEANAFMSYTDYIEIPVNAKSLITNRKIKDGAGTEYNQSQMVSFYDANKQFISRTTGTAKGDLLETVIPNHTICKYIRVNFSRNYRPQFIAFNPYSSLTAYGTQMQSTNYTQLSDFPANSICLIGDIENNFTDTPYQRWDGMVVTLSGMDSDSIPSGNLQIAISAKSLPSGEVINRIHYRFCWGPQSVWRDWVEVFTEYSLEIGLGLVGEFQGSFTQAKQQINTGIAMEANEKYIIRAYSPRTGRVNIYGFGNTDNYKSLHKYHNEISFVNDDTSRYLCLFNPSEDIFDIKLKVFKSGSVLEKSSKVPTKYVVSKYDSAIADYESLTKCLLDLKDDDSPKIIEVLEGDYDIYQEYKDAGVPVYTGSNPAMDYFDYCVWVPKNTHLIGKGIVRLKWMPTKAANPEITWKQCETVSTLNVAGTATIENVEIHCKNGRYCIHNDGLGKDDFTGAVQKYINVKCYKYVNEEDTTTTPGETHAYGFSSVTGFGIDRSMIHIYENCLFKNEIPNAMAFYGHTRATADQKYILERMSSNIVLNNCIIDATGNNAVKLGSITNDNAPIHVRTDFNNCYISSTINLVSESSSEPQPDNNFDVTLLNCGSVTMHIANPSGNRYAPKAYNTTLTLV